MITVAIFFLLTLVLKMNGDFVKLVRFSFADTGADPGGCWGPCLPPPSSKYNTYKQVRGEGPGPGTGYPCVVKPHVQGSLRGRSGGIPVHISFRQVRWRLVKRMTHTQHVSPASLNFWIHDLFT